MIKKLLSLFKKKDSLTDDINKEFQQHLSSITPEIDGKPIFELAHEKRHDLEFMLKACNLIEYESYNHDPESFFPIYTPLPYYFKRAAILANKNKDYKLVIEICEKWLRLAKKFTKERNYLMKKDPLFSCADATIGTSDDMGKRLEKAKLKLQQIKNNQ